MNQKLRNMFIIFFGMILVIVLSGCSDSKEASNSGTPEKNSETIEIDIKNSEAANQDIQDFVLEHTKMVKIFNISQRNDQRQPDLGPFQVVEGIDNRGQKVEVWIKDNKIYEMNNFDNN